MRTLSLPSNETSLGEYSAYPQLSVSLSERPISYSRHLSFQHDQIFVNGRSRLLVCTTVRSPTHDPCPIDKESFSNILITGYPQNQANTLDSIPNSDDHFRRQQVLAQSSSIRWNNDGAIRTFPEANRYPSKLTDIKDKNNYVEEWSRRQPFSSYSNKEKKESWANSKDLFEDATRNKNKKKYPCGHPCSCPYLLASLLTALLLGIIVAIALLTTLLKSQTATTTTTMIATDSTTVSTITQSTTALTTTTAVATVITTTTATTTETTTTVATTLSTTALSTTLTTTSLTTTITSTTSTITTTTASTTATTTSCNTPTSTIAYFNNAPTSYTQKTYNYTASSTYNAVLQFGFVSGNNGGGNPTYLDAVSIVDKNTSNTEVLVNGDFENSTTLGWQELCISSCKTQHGVINSATLCHIGLFCYVYDCGNTLGFLRQPFSVITGHVYQLSFWLQVDNAEDVYVQIF